MTDPTRADQVWSLVSAHAEERAVPVSVTVVCQVAAARLPVAGAAISIRGSMVASESLASTNQLSRDLEELQLTIGEGPSLEVLEGGPSVLADDFAGRQWQSRWPMFGPQAVEAGAEAVFALPMRIGAIRGGVLALYGDRPTRLTTENLAEAWVFASLALRVLLDAQDGITETNDGYPAVDPLSDARAEVHQAAGMISVQLDVSISEAFSRLRARAFGDGRALSSLAEDVVAGRLTFSAGEP